MVPSHAPEKHAMAAKKKSHKKSAKKAGSAKKKTASAKRPPTRSSGESDTALRDLARSFAAKLLR
jgi:hypothetical protein